MTPAAGFRVAGVDVERPGDAAAFVGATGFDGAETEAGFFARPPLWLLFDWGDLEEGKRDSLAMGRSYHGAAVVGVVDEVLGGRALPAGAN